LNLVKTPFFVPGDVIPLEPYQPVGFAASRWAFLLTFAGVGLRTNLKDLFKQGARPFIVGAVGEVAIAAITLLLVLGADHLYHL
jgi:uncharacterized membrane protein YadS